MKDQSIILLSGGLDSTLALFLALEESRVRLVLTFDYGQNAAPAEIRATQNLAQKYRIPHQTIKLDFLKQRDHPLTGQEKKLPKLTLSALDDPLLTQKSAHAVWVPNRNGVFINVAASLAEQHGTRRIYVGFNAEEAATFPDNSQAFVTDVNKSLALSTQNQVEVFAPTIHMNKGQIVKDLIKRNFDFSLLWSCYRNGEKMCGVCESCLRLKRALIENGHELQLFIS